MLGGIGRFGHLRNENGIDLYTIVTRTFTNLPIHHGIKIIGRYHILDCFY